MYMFIHVLVLGFECARDNHGRISYLYTPVRAASRSRLGGAEAGWRFRPSTRRQGNIPTFFINPRTVIIPTAITTHPFVPRFSGEADFSPIDLVPATTFRAHSDTPGS